MVTMTVGGHCRQFNKISRYRQSSPEAIRPFPITYRGDLLGVIGNLGRNLEHDSLVACSTRGRSSVEIASAVLYQAAPRSSPIDTAGEVVERLC